ncbi:hypothetical protein PRK78_000964 [Emydomyces testavorans]|uniref:Uncharacterized protein n=1 Tax=Emydomyces testavorans TaxID=2070801 RepID=A0AAF0DC35_9EURO|nr:hypothetical protein PRK78_000964 [Emydomyces testavorans]
MTRLLPFLSLIAATVVTCQEGMGAEGQGMEMAMGGEGKGMEMGMGAEGQGAEGNSLPFALPGGEGGGQIGGEGGRGGEGQVIGGESRGGEAGGAIIGGGREGIGGGRGGGRGGQNVVSVTIITTNAGGGANTREWNKPPVREGVRHKVSVGGQAGLVFTPETLNPAVGDMVEFTFQSQNHTVSQSTFDQPCMRMGGGLDSGFMPNPNNTVNPAPTMMFQVTTKEPIWMYCRQMGHCQKGMVFSLNPTAEKSHEAFKQKAKESGGQRAEGGRGGQGARPPTPPPASPPASAPVGGAPIGTGIPGVGRPPMGGEAGRGGQGGEAGRGGQGGRGGEGGQGGRGGQGGEGGRGGQGGEAGRGGQGGRGGQVVPGTGNGGACACSCLCGVSQFPPGAGLGSVGGFGGM